MALGDFGRDLLAEAARIAQQTVAREGTHLRWATVTGVDPLRIRYDGEPNPSIVTPQTTEANLVVGDRVQIGKQHGQATILGLAGGDRRTAFAEAAGHADVTAASGTTSGDQTVTLPAGRFNVPPRVVVTPITTSANISGWAVYNTSATEFTIRVYRANGGTTRLNWVAKQMTPTSAEG